jgi:hypothetical protein
MLEQYSRPRSRVVMHMESFCANSAKSFIGRNVNLHLKDGAVIVNVLLTGIHRVSSKHHFVEFALTENKKTSQLPLRNVAWAEIINSNLLQKAA